MVGEPDSFDRKMERSDCSRSKAGRGEAQPPARGDAGAAQMGSGRKTEIEDFSRPESHLSGANDDDL